MEVRRAMVLVMTHMALADGKVTSQEAEFLTSMLGPGEDLASLETEARSRSLADLLEPLTVYADRFFVALRAASMAHIDLEFDAREEELYERLVKLLEIEKADCELIQRSVAALDADVPSDPEPRIFELFAQSSLR